MKKHLFPTFLVVAASFALAPLAWASPKLGAPAPDFTLSDTHGKELSLSDFKGKIVVLEWTNYNCPFVKKFYEPGEMQKLQKEITGEGVVWLSIASTNPDHKDYKTPDVLNAYGKDHHVAATAVLMDSDGKVGRLYGAKTTPHMYVIDAEGKLAYAGAIDSIKSPKSADIAKAENHVVKAVEEVRAGKPVSTPGTKAYGCSVKYAE